MKEDRLLSFFLHTVLMAAECLKSSGNKLGIKVRKPDLSCFPSSEQTQEEGLNFIKKDSTDEGVSPPG